MNHERTDMWTWPSYPMDVDEFNAMMSSLDQHLIQRDLRLAQRSLHAVRLVARRFALVGCPFAGVRGMPDTAFESSHLLHHVFHWYSPTRGYLHSVHD